MTTFDPTTDEAIVDILAEEAAFFGDDGEPTEETWATVSEYVQKAWAISYEGCHKIYVLMDQAQAVYQQSLDAGYTITAPDFACVKQWYENSCPYRFITAVATIDGDPEGPNAIDGFTRLIPQYSAYGR